MDHRLLANEITMMMMMMSYTDGRCWLQEFRE